MSYENEYLFTGEIALPQPIFICLSLYFTCESLCHFFKVHGPACTAEHVCVKHSSEVLFSLIHNLLLHLSTIESYCLSTFLFTATPVNGFHHQQQLI